MKWSMTWSMTWMKRVGWACCIAGLGVVSPSAYAGSSDDVAQIEGLYATWRRAVEASDVQGYLGILHADVRLLPPGAAAVDGRDNYAKFLGPVFATATYKIEVHQLPQVEIVGDAAIAEYDYTIYLTLKNPDIGISEPGALTESSTTARYFDVLRREDGRWAVWRHSWAERQP